MNYQDTSSLTGTDARSDADVIPAGSNAPAVGNTITGTGTVSGTAGADVVGSAPGHVVAVQGAGGGDTSASGEAMQVSGRYGVLNMQADGDYRYTRNGDTPDGVRDVFTYTLADAGESRDTATLTIDIGREPVVVQATAQQVVPGPDGVITLPAGVTMANVHVVGRNLVIDMPDGTQMIIVDGAVFVPQLVLGGVEIPASTVASLLVDSEPPIAPTAGTPQSGGGNFGLPPGPLDPGVPLGDLIPPVESDYEPPIFEDVGQFVDDEPEIFIQPDGQPASVAAVDQVDERGLPSRNEGEPAGSGEIADGNGANNSDTRETTTGSIIIDANDTPVSISITVNNTTTVLTGVVPQVIVGQYGNLTITSISDTAIGYSYTLRDNTSGDATHDDFLVTLTDNDGDQASATLRIDIIDDVPTANADVDSVTEDGPLVATGNVRTGGTDAGDANTTDGVADVTGADNASLTSFNGAGGNGTFGNPLAGTYGSIVLNSNGTYTYTLNNANAAVQGLDTGETLIETYNYTITDGDGDTSTTTLRITINGANDAPVALDDTNWTVEDGGTISGNVLNNVAHNGAPDEQPRADVADTDVDVEDLDVSIVGSLVGTYGTLTLDAETGAYTYALNNALPAVQALGVGETLIETYTYASSDGTASDNATLTITIFGTNDAPVAIDDTNWTQEDGGTISGNVLNNVAHNGAPDEQPRADVADTDVDGDDLDVSLNGNPVGSYGTLTLNAETGAYTYALNNALPAVQALGVGETLIETYTYTSSDGNGGTDTATLTITIFGTNDLPVAIDDTNWTVEDGGTISGNVLNNVAHNGAPDGAPRADVADTDVDGDDLDVAIVGSLVGSYGTLTLNAETGAYTYALNNALPAVQALSVGETLIETYTYTANDGNGGTDNATLTITIFGTNDAPVAIDDTNWTQEDGGTIAGNVLANVAHNGAPDGTPRADVADTDVDGDDLDVAIVGSLNGTYGVLTLNAETGAYTYALNNALPAIQGLDTGETLIETYSYTANDGNGGTDTATLTITIFGTNDAPVAINDTNWTVEDGATISGNVLNNVAHNGAPDGAPRADVADTDVDGEDLDVAIIGSLVGTYGTLTLDAETGAYTYALNNANAAVQGLDTGETLIEVFQYNASDGTASDGATLTITIFGANDAPVALNDTNWTIEDGATISGNVLNNVAHNGAPDGTPRADVADTDVDGEDLDVSIIGSLVGTYGTLTLDAETGAYTYTLNNALPAIQGLDTGETLIETFQYNATDGTASDGATLTITIFGQNDAPVALNDTNWTIEDGGTISGNVLINLAHNGAPDGTPRSDVADTDVDGEDLDVAIIGSLIGTYGTLTLDAETGAYTYDLNDALPAVQALTPGQTLIETFQYNASDGTATDGATLTITIFGSNDGPNAINDTNWTIEDGGTISGNVLVNTPHNGAPDGAPRSDVADTDPDGDDLDVAIIGSLNGTYGVLTLNAETGAYTYDLNDANPVIQALDTGETLIETFQYNASDGIGSDGATLTITIFGQNDAPVALNDTNWTIEDGATISGNVLVNTPHNGAPDGAPRSDVADTDVDVEDLDVAIIGSLNGTYGVLTLDAETGAYTYDLNDALPAVQALDTGETLIEVFQYNASDGTASDGATLTITIFGANDAPTIQPSSVTISDEGVTGGNPDGVGVPSDDTNLASAGGTMTVADVDGEALTVTFTSYPTGLSVDGNALTWTGSGTNTITGSFNGTTYLTLTINNSGAYTVTLQNHGLDHPLGGAEQEFNFTANVQVSDGTTTNSAVLTVTIEDDSPTISAGNTTTLNIDNNANPYNEGVFVMSVGGDKNFDNNDIALSGFTVSVNGSDVPATILTEVENAVSVTYTFEFTYDTGNGGEVTETGTMIFYKTGPDAGTYTVELDNPIAGFSTLETADGSAFVGYVFNTSTVTGSQPDVAVTTILEESGVGENDGFYVQFTGLSSGNGDHETINPPFPDATADGSWNEGDLFSEGTSLHQSWVSVSGGANGVAGDTVNGPDVLNFNLYSSNPTGTFSGQTGNLPTASASDMFLSFDGIGATDDFIVVLKLWNDTNGTPGIQADDAFTTVSIVVSADDIYRFGGDGVGSDEQATLDALAGTAYEDVAAAIAAGNGNNNDGLVIIESNDYDPTGEGWQIVGAQVINTNAGVSGTGADLNPDVGDDGGDTGDTQAFSTVDDTAPMKITNIGFLTGTSEDQQATIEFTLTVTDSDGDSVTQDYTVNVGDYPADTTEPSAMEALVTKVSTAPTTSSLISDADQQQAANTNTVLLGAIAGAGLMSASAAAAAPSFDYAGFDYGSFSQSSLLSSTSLQSVDHQGLTPMFESTMDARWEGQSFGDNGSSFQQMTVSSEGLAPAAMDLPALSQLGQGYDMPVNMQAMDASTFASADVVMPSLEALVASFAQNGGATQLSGVVADVLADALAGGGDGLSIDSLLNGLPGLGGTGMDALASHGMTGVSAWDMGAFGGFTGIHQAFTMETLVLHQDTVMPQA